MAQIPNELYRTVVGELSDDRRFLLKVCQVSRVFRDEGQRALFRTVEMVVRVANPWPLRKLELFHEAIASSDRLARLVRSYSQLIDAMGGGFSTGTEEKLLKITFSLMSKLNSLEALEFFYGTRLGPRLAKRLADCGATFKLRQFSWSTDGGCDREEEDAESMERFLQSQRSIVDIYVDLWEWRPSTSVPMAAAVSGTADRIQALLPGRPVKKLFWTRCSNSVDWSKFSSRLENITHLSFDISRRCTSFPTALLGHMPHLAVLEVRNALPDVSVESLFVGLSNSD